MSTFDVLKIVSLFIAVWWTIINSGRFIRGQKVYFWNIIFQALGITVFVYMQWLV